MFTILRLSKAKYEKTPKMRTKHPQLKPLIESLNLRNLAIRSGDNAFAEQMVMEVQNNVKISNLAV